MRDIAERVGITERAAQIIVTVGSLIGKGGLGDLILGGFRNNFYKAEILAGAVLCVALALVLDLALAGLTRLLTPWTRERRS